MWQGSNDDYYYRAKWQKCQGLSGKKEAKMNNADGHFIFRRWITKNGQRIYPSSGHKAFKIWVPDDKRR
jgi:hypothetical protein